MMDYHSKIRDWPPDQRPRDRLFQHGTDRLSDAELLAIILRTGITGATAVAMAQKLLAEYGGFRGLDKRAASELCHIPGLGPAKVAQIKAALAIGKKLMSEHDPVNESINTSRDVYNRVGLSLRDRTREVLLVMFLTARNKIIKEQILFEGTLTESIVSPREVIKEALNEAAAGLVVVHNHPSGEVTPSKEDVDLTKRLKNACELVGIRFLDHIIIGGEKYYSFAENLLL